MFTQLRTTWRLLRILPQIRPNTNDDLYTSKDHALIKFAKKTAAGAQSYPNEVAYIGFA